MTSSCVGKIGPYSRNYLDINAIIFICRSDPCMHQCIIWNIVWHYVELRCLVLCFLLGTIANNLSFVWQICSTDINDIRDDVIGRNLMNISYDYAFCSANDMKKGKYIGNGPCLYQIGIWSSLCLHMSWHLWRRGSQQAQWWLQK